METGGNGTDGNGTATWIWSRDVFSACQFFRGEPNPTQQKKYKKNLPNRRLELGKFSQQYEPLTTEPS